MVVVAAGAESRALVAPLGFDLPIVEEPRTLFLSEPIRERLLEPLVIAVDRGIAAKQLADGRVLASDLRGERAGEWRAPPARAAAGARVRPVADRRDRLVRHDARRTADRRRARRRALGRGRLQRARVHGRAEHGPLVADGIAGAALPEWHEAVRVGRFEERPADTEAQVI